MKYKFFLVTLLLSAFFGFSVAANAATFSAPTTAYATIQAALNAAGATGDVVLVTAGTYAEDLTISKDVTLKCSTASGVVTLTGALLNAPAITFAAGSSNAVVQNFNVDISANASKLAGTPAVNVVSGITGARLYRSTFKSGATALTAVQFAGVASGWQIEDCTFTITSPGNIGIAFIGAAAVTSMDILGNVFNGVNGALGVTSAKMLFASAAVTTLTGLNVTGNVVNKATLQINVDGATPSAEVVNTINIAVNYFTESNAILFQSTNAADVATNSTGLKAAAAVIGAAGDILIKGNHFGSTATNGNQQYAIKFAQWNGLDVNESNIHINYNNFQYPMTSGTDTNANGGHVTVQATSGLTAIDAKFNWWGTLTGYNTSYQDGGNAVLNPAYDGTQFISSYVTPQVDETNRGVEFYDWDGNGKLDRAVVFFDYYLDPASVMSNGGWSVAGYTLDSTRLPKLGLDNSGTGSSDGPFALTLFLVEGSAMDTGLTPQTTYAKQNGYVAGISGNINAKLNDILAATATEHDKAKPVIKTAVTGDANKNGKIDKITVTFSEPITLNAPTGGSIDDTDWDNNVGNPTGYVLNTLAGTESTASGDVLTLLFGEVGYDTGAKPSFTITQDGTDDYKDNTGNLMATVTFTGTADGAPPIAYAVATKDWSTSDRGEGDPDGYIDGFNVTFSENVSIAYADSAAARNQFVPQAITAGAVENTMNLKTALITGGGTTVLSIKGKSMKDASTAYGSHPWDTDRKPTLGLTSPSGIKDAAGNNFVTFWTTSSVTTFNLTTDTADPVIVKAVGQVNSTNIYLTFSEYVKGTGAGNTIVAADLAYVNIYNTGANATAIIAMADNSASTDYEARATVDATLLVADVENDSLKVAVLGNIKDLVNNNLQIKNVTINDVIPPVLISAVTKDVDNDGWVDHILLTFSETVDDLALTGYNGGAKISLDTALPNWAVAGYTVIGLNFVSTAAEQTTATTDAVARGIAFAADELGKVINVADTASDNALWLMVKEVSGPDQTAGDTQAIPALTITGAAGANVVDYKPNQLVTVTSTPTDGAGPAIMSAKMTGTNSLQVTISETVNTSNILTGGTITGNELIGSDFKIMFGETLVDLGVPSIIKDVVQNAGIIDMFWPNTVVPAGESGYIGFSAAGTVKDVATVNVTNTQHCGTANNVGLKAITAWIAPVDPGSTPPAVAKAALTTVPATMAQINNLNVAQVAFYGTATAGDTISVKLVDLAGLESAVATAVVNTAGSFTGTVNASALANGMVTLKAGKAVGGAVASWVVFADYLKDAVTIGAPTALAVTDVPGDNGGFVYVNFTVSPQHPGLAGATPFNTVQSYQLYKRGTVAPDTLWTAWASFPANFNQLLPNNKLQVPVATVKNGTMQWKMVASVLPGITSGATSAASGGSAKVADLLDGADKAAEGLFSDVSNVAVGGSIDNIAPSALTVFSADNTAGKGITVSWTPTGDHGIVSGYTFNGMTIPIYGVEKYEIYRAVKGTTTFTLVGYGAPGSTSFLDTTAPAGTTVYDYYIKLVDGNPDNTVKLADMLAMSSIGGAGGCDFNSDGTVGLADLVLLGQAWGTKQADRTTWISLFDVSVNGLVDLGDLVVLGQNWGKTGSAKIASTVPAISNPFELKAEVNESTSMYYVNVNVKDAATYNGVAFTLNYDTKAFEFVQESVNGLVGITLANESAPGVIDVASYFQNEKFNGTITLGFKSKGLNSDMNLKMVNAEMSVNDVVSAVSGAPAVTLKALPTVYAMAQNFPNPFNPTTTIEYSIPKSSQVELAIYNMAGQKVRTLVNTTQAASFYRVIWNGRNDAGQTVASGLYFYKLNAGNYSKVVKMNLIK